MQNSARMKTIPASTKLPEPTHRSAVKMCDSVGLNLSQALRLGLDRLIEEFRQTGTLALKAAPKK